MKLLNKKKATIVFKQEQPEVWFEKTADGQAMINTLKKRFGKCEFFSDELLFDLLYAKVDSSQLFVYAKVNAVFEIAKTFNLKIVKGETKDYRRMEVVLIDDLVKCCYALTNYCTSCQQIVDKFREASEYLGNCKYNFSNQQFDAVEKLVDKSITTFEEAKKYFEEVKQETFRKRCKHQFERYQNDYQTDL